MKPPDRSQCTMVRAGRSEVRKQSSTSLASIFSSFTNNSGGSSGRTSTVAQESVSRPRMRSSKYTVSSKSSSKRRSMPNAGTNAANAKETEHIPGPMPNVFEFLDPQQSSTSLVTPAAVPSDPQTPTPNAPDLSEDTQKEGLNT